MKYRKVKVSDGAIKSITLELQMGRLVSGPYIEKVEEQMRNITGAPYAIAVSSGTMALEIAMKAMGVNKYSNVIMPDITFVSCVSSVIHLGAEPFYAEVNAKDFLLDYADVSRIIDKLDKTEREDTFIMDVNLGGASNLKLEKEFKGAKIIRDCAHTVMYVPEGTTCFSFYPTKVVSGIDGGCITTDDYMVYKKAKILRNFGFIPSTRIASEHGYKANLTNISAALIYHNLVDVRTNLGTRDSVRQQYNKEFDLENIGLGMYMVLVDNPDEVCRKLNGQAIRHYPETLSYMFDKKRKNKNAEFIADHLISLPFHEFMLSDEVDEVIKVVKKYLIHL